MGKETTQINKIYPVFLKDRGHRTTWTVVGIEIVIGLTVVSISVQLLCMIQFYVSMAFAM